MPHNPELRTTVPPYYVERSLKTSHPGSFLQNSDTHSNEPTPSPVGRCKLRYDWSGMGVGDDVEPIDIVQPVEMIITPCMSEYKRMLRIPLAL